MTKTLRICACFVVVLAAAAPAAADWQITPFIGVTFKGSTTFFDPENQAAGETFSERSHRMLGASVSWIGRRPLGIEGLVAVVPGIFDRGGATLVLSSRSVAAMGNLFVAIPRSWSEYGLRPFVSGGFGLFHVTQINERDFSFRRNVVGYNVGGGVSGPLSVRTAVRIEVRRFGYVRSAEEQGFTISPECVTDCRERLSYWSANVGLSIRVRR